MTLWIFGDSFSTPQKHMTGMLRSGNAPKFVPLDKTWTSIVSESLTNNPEHKNYSIQGCSNQYIWINLLYAFPSIKKDDYVIVQLTSSFRHWFWEDRPHLANYSNTKFIPGEDASKIEIDAIKMYQKYLNADFLSESSYQMLIFAVQNIAAQLAGKAKVLILPGFHSVPGVKGNLVDVSAAEFDNVATKTAYYKKTSDSRYNHFSDENHKILADKVCDFFTDFKMVDLTTGFKSNIYTKDTVANISGPDLY